MPLYQASFGGKELEKAEYLPPGYPDPMCTPPFVFGDAPFREKENPLSNRGVDPTGFEPIPIAPKATMLPGYTMGRSSPFGLFARSETEIHLHLSTRLSRKAGRFGTYRKGERSSSATFCPAGSGNRTAHQRVMSPWSLPLDDPGKLPQRGVPEPPSGQEIDRELLSEGSWN